LTVRNPDIDPFDHLTRLFGRPAGRRRLAAAVGAFAAAALPQAGAADRKRRRRQRNRNCLPIGFTCGGPGQPACDRCCSGFATDSGTTQERCTCRRLFDPCERDDQCCDGLCLLDPPSTGVDVAVCVPFPPLPPPAG
jgi:hypothetical protein